MAFSTQYNVSVAPLVSKSNLTKCTSRDGYSLLTAASIPYSASMSHLLPNQTASVSLKSRLSNNQKSMGRPTTGIMGLGVG